MREERKKKSIIFYLHWNEAEVKERIKPLKQSGWKVISHGSTEKTPQLGKKLPDVFVISLVRLPSHGRAIAQWLRESKKRAPVPLAFVDGKPDKVAETRQKFPDAIYCTSDNLIAVLRKVLERC